MKLQPLIASSTQYKGLSINRSIITACPFHTPLQNLPPIHRNKMAAVLQLEVIVAFMLASVIVLQGAPSTACLNNAPICEQYYTPETLKKDFTVQCEVVSNHDTCDKAFLNFAGAFAGKDPTLVN